MDAGPVQLVRRRAHHVPIEGRREDCPNDALMGNRHRISACSADLGQQRLNPAQDLAGALAPVRTKVQSLVLILPHGLPKIGTEILQGTAFPSPPVHFDQAGIGWNRLPAQDPCGFPRARERTRNPGKACQLGRDVVALDLRAPRPGQGHIAQALNPPGLREDGGSVAYQRERGHEARRAASWRVSAA